MTDHHIDWDRVCELVRLRDSVTESAMAMSDEALAEAITKARAISDDATQEPLRGVMAATFLLGLEEAARRRQ